MFFSILIPAYNKAAYVARCLDSVIGQSYEDFEVVFIDDGSTDRTLEIASLYKDKRLRIIHSENRGVSSARNSAIEASSGKYLLFLDADDAFAPCFLQRVHDDIISADFPNIVIGGLIKISGSDYKTVISSVKGVFDSESYKAVFMHDMIENGGLPGYIANKAVSRDFILSNSFYFNPDLKLAEDLDFWVDCYRFAKSIIVSDNDGYLYYTGTLGSSVYERNIDYISQLYIWSKIREYVSPADSKVMGYLDAKFSGYAVSAFNELCDITMENVRFLLQGIKEHKNKTQYRFIDSGQPLSFLISLGFAKPIYYYLRLRKIVHDKRHNSRL